MEKATWAKREPKVLRVSKGLVTPQRWTNRAPQRIERLFCQARHEELRDYCELLVHRSDASHNKTVDSIAAKALFFHARSHYYQGQWQAVSESLKKLFHYLPNHADAHYLAADNARMAGDTVAARDYLEALYPKSKRLKTWLYMAELVQTPDDWKRMQRCIKHALQLKKIPEFNPSLNDYFAKGAQRGGDFTVAKSYWRQNLKDAIQNSESFRVRSRKVNFSVLEASQALTDIKAALSLAGIPMFLVSGTLLGCMREGGLLGHDHDIDIGIWDDINPQKLIEIISQAGVFHLLPQRYSGCLRVKHINSTAIDVFTHYRERHTYWHGGGKVRWHNSAFTLKQHKFLAQYYFVPEDHDTYLTENYGEWRISQHTFDSTLDTPNAEVLCEEELILHVYQQCYKAVVNNRANQIERYRTLLASLGEQSI
ncbi:tetratricopeptide repeat protein [Vreelandella profundi]|uniref:tetratricopeptide repeat protein n=1 Tax=Vreelandella profundi TaxID=2852117 RepID=UPI001EF12498|nr:tetratricopeptide repeat protein [Halomonas profundi]